MFKPSPCSLFQFRLYKGVEPRWENRESGITYINVLKKVFSQDSRQAAQAQYVTVVTDRLVYITRTQCVILKWQVEMIIISCQWLGHVTATFFKLPVEPGTSRCVTFVLDRHITNLVSSKHSSLTHKNNFIFHKHAHSFQLPKIIYGAKVGIHNVSLYHPTGGETQKQW